jgi:hypothetical protein
MGWKTRLLVPSLAAVGYLIASFFIKIVPCQISANIPNPSFTWSLCTLNPDKVSLFGVREMYWGISTQLSEAYLISIGLIFICCFLFIVPLTRKKHTSFPKSKDKKGSERGFETY